MAPHLDAVDALAREAEPVDTADGLAVHDPQLRRGVHALPESQQVTHVRDEPARGAPRARFLAARIFRSMSARSIASLSPASARVHAAIASSQLNWRI